MNRHINNPHVVCTWELGGNLGHIIRYLSIVKELQKQGVRVSLILRDLSKVHSILGTLGCDIYQAPVMLQPVREAPSPPISYPEILLNYGYHSSDVLTGLVKAWRAQIEHLKPSLLMFDFSPTAQLATLDMDIPRIMIGGAFQMSPEQSPMPAFTNIHEISQKRLEENENNVLQVVNRCVPKWGGVRFNIFHEMLQVDERFLCTLPELDFYRPWRVSDPFYYGPVGKCLSGVEPQWPGRGEIRIFLYLRKSHPLTIPLLITLQQFDVSILAYVPEIDKAVVNKFDATKIRFSKRPFQMDHVVGQCDLGVYHAGDGTLSYITANGKPSILLPEQVEQGLLAGSAKKMGVAKVVEPDFEKNQLIDVFTEAMDGDIARIASMYAKEHPQFRTSNPLHIIIQRLMKLLR